MLPEYDCVTCTAQLKSFRGCDKDVEGPYALMINGEVHRRCPRRPILDDPEWFVEVFWLYRQKEKGYLGSEGGLDDQPNKLVQAFQVIDHTVNICTQAKEEQDKAKKRRRALTAGAKQGTGKRRKT